MPDHEQSVENKQKKGKNSPRDNPYVESEKRSLNKLHAEWNLSKKLGSREDSDEYKTIKLEVGKLNKDIREKKLGGSGNDDVGVIIDFVYRYMDIIEYCDQYLSKHQKAMSWQGKNRRHLAKKMKAQSQEDIAGLKAVANEITMHSREERSQMTVYGLLREARTSKIQDGMKYNVATSRLAGLLDLGELVARPELKEPTGKPNAKKHAKKNMTAATLYNHQKEEREFILREQFNDTVDWRAVKRLRPLPHAGPGFFKALSSLQVLDALCMQQNRSTDNYLIQQDPKSRVLTGVQGINNDVAFGLREQFPKEKSQQGRQVYDDKFNLVIPYMDKNLADSIKNVDEAQVIFLLKDLLKENEIAYTISRLWHIKQAIARLSDAEKENRLIDDEGWSKGDVQRRMMSAGSDKTLDNTYARTYKESYDRKEKARKILRKKKAKPSKQTNNEISKDSGKLSDEQIRLIIAKQEKERKQFISIYENQAKQRQENIGEAETLKLPENAKKETDRIVRRIMEATHYYRVGDIEAISLFIDNQLEQREDCILFAMTDDDMRKKNDQNAKIWRLYGETRDKELDELMSCNKSISQILIDHDVENDDVALPREPIAELRERVDLILENQAKRKKQIMLILKEQAKAKQRKQTTLIIEKQSKEISGDGM